ncbi:hypothetical protein CPC08DRAFT_769237 [Agrocybe pediades]|nr:hypothetical protein CPC08DRAFT_769237 [Agrocybe pediades]
MLCLGANYPDKSGHYFQVCTTCDPKYFHWLDIEPSRRALRDAQPLLDILAEIESYSVPRSQSHPNMQPSSSPPATPQHTSTQHQRPRSRATCNANKRHREEDSDSSNDNNSGSHRPRKFGRYAREDTPPPPLSLNAEEIETGEAFNLTCSIKVDIHIDGCILHEVMYPRKDGWFRLCDFKVMLGKEGFEQMRAIQDYNFCRSKWEYCLWDTPYPVEKDELFLFRYAP